MIGEDDPVAVIPLGLEVTLYCVIVAPPSDAGALNVTAAWVLPATAEIAVGAPGTVAGATGVTAFDGPLADPIPTEFVAVTVNV
jgi:hypothetical protein